MMVSTTRRVVIAGDGVVGLSCALHLMARGTQVTLLCPGFSGAASPASAGMLAPSVEWAQGPAQNFSDAAREAWVPLREIVRSFGGPSFDIQREGILRIARDEAGAAHLRSTLRGADTWLDPASARRRVPLLGDIAGAALYEGDGVIDAPAAVHAMRAALQRAARASTRLSIVPAPLAAISSAGPGIRGQFGDGTDVTADFVVLAAGAWSGAVAGLPRVLPVRPLRGALVALDCAPPPFPVYDGEGHAYVFPRAGSTVVGATSDEADFDARPRDSDADRLVQAATGMMPGLASCSRGAMWVGLRPMTPDGLAIIGSDPDLPQLLYALGHGRNGFLQAALTGEVIAGIVLNDGHPVDLSPFNPSRFNHL